MTNYNTVTAADYEIIKGLAAPERVLFGEEVSEDYGRDELSAVSSRPEIVVKAICTEEVSKVLSYANEA